MDRLADSLRTVGSKRNRAKGAYLALLVLSALYFGRPEDLVPGLSQVPLAKIAGGIAVVALILSLMSGRIKEKLALENKFLLAFFGWYCVGILFATWHGGAFSTVTTRLSKGIVASLLVSLTVRELWQLKRLIWVQAASVAVVTVASVALHRTQGGRLMGASLGILENPNDLANNIAMNWPLCVAFFFLARSIKKVLWAAAVLIMLLAVELTYSRSGFLAIALAAVLVLWEFGVRGRRLYLVLAAGILGVIVLVASPGHYAARIASIVTGQEADTMDRGSREARKELLVKSVETGLRHPVFGIGAGNFEVTNGAWRVAHNTYTEIAAEAGLPAFVLFVLVLYRTFFNLRMVRRSAPYHRDKEMRVITGGLWVSAAAYIVTAFFASTEFNMYPYFLVAYTTALYQISGARLESGNLETGEDPPSTSGRHYGRREARELAGTRG